MALIVVATFAASLGGQFLAWDDQANFLSNPFYRGFTADNLRWMWTTHLLGHYTPLSWMSLALDYELWGMNPLGYHITNVLLHAVSAAAADLLLLRIFVAVQSDGSRPELPRIAAAFGALLFALHPLRVESVAWITERRDVLSLALALLSALAFFESRQRPGRRYYVASITMFACALLAKASAVTLPLVLLICAIHPMRWVARDGRTDTTALRRLLVQLVPFFLLALAAGLYSIVALEPGPQLPVAKKLALTSYALGFYVTKTIFPTRLAALYEMPPVFHPFEARYLASYAVTAIVLAVAIATARKRPGVTVAIAAFVVVALPTLGLAQNGPTLAADRYTYHAGLALAALAAASFVVWPRRTRRLVAVGVAMIVTLAALSIKQSSYWHDSTTLWTRVLDIDSNSAMAHNSLGVELAQAGKVDLAMREYQRAVALNQRYADPHNNLGYELARLGRAPEAIAEFEAALTIQPRMVDAEVNWGNVLYTERQFEPAISHYRRATEIAPTHAGAHFNWAMALAAEHRQHDAVKHLEIAHDLDPADPDTRAALAGLRAGAPALR